MHSVISVEILATEVDEKESRLEGIAVGGKCGGIGEEADRSLK